MHNYKRYVYVFFQKRSSSSCVPHRSISSHFRYRQRPTRSNSVKCTYFRAIIHPLSYLIYCTMMVAHTYIINDVYNPHRGQPPCRGSGALHRWPERFLKSWGEELTKSRPNPWEQIATRYQCFCAGFGFTADYGFTAVYLRLHSRLRLYSRYL